MLTLAAGQKFQFSRMVFDVLWENSVQRFSRYAELEIETRRILQSKSNEPSKTNCVFLVGKKVRNIYLKYEKG